MPKRQLEIKVSGSHLVMKFGEGLFVALTRYSTGTLELALYPEDTNDVSQMLADFKEQVNKL